MAPAFGAEDMEMANKHGLPVLMTVQPDGTFVQEVTPWRGTFIKNADPLIVEDLRARGLLFRVEDYSHTYPFCWRCSTPLMYYARDSWFIRTSRFKDRLVALNNTINWVPEHVREGRFGNWLENNMIIAHGERIARPPVWE
jgi:isoleucyl-tRNA synthetase